MDHIGADQLDRDRITGVDSKFRGGIGKLVRFNSEGSFLRGNGLNWKWSKSHHQSSHDKEERKVKMRAHV
jgi:hypothetical protein